MLCYINTIIIIIIITIITIIVINPNHLTWDQTQFHQFSYIPSNGYH